ncbi:accessory gland protein Acp29AB-like [Drosophila kikkawai]|uniref:Accessory gland protein Acp29AB-like n=1 Tax=Drosophila kikkawai TaxID=30033 RepID=A0A6P4HU24_DROKI|nr:accessory gland protein Acp29AB-like [Drosophila kikkawai]
MLKSAAICLYFATVAWHVNKCLADPKDSGRSVCLLDDPPNQCGQFCLTALKPMINHIDRHQDEWMSACGATKANQTQGKLEHIKSQLLSLQSGQSNMQEALRKVGSSLETSWEKLNPEDVKARLERMESQSTAQMELLKAVKTSMEASKQAVPRDFVKAGSRYFYIEDNSKQNWFSAGHTCRRMGGYLASPRKEELDALNLKAGVTYWFGISDLADEGRFISSFNGNPASFLKWRPNEPNNVRNSQHCVTFNNRGMDDDNCDKKFNFICQASEENL